MARFKETAMHIVFLITACVSIAAVALICVYLLGNGIPTIAEIGPSNFFGSVWKPAKDLYGIFPFIIGSIYATAGAIVVGVPVGVLCAVFLAYFCPRWLYRILNPAVRLMAGVPSIVYGFWGLMVIVPAVQRLTGTSGKGLLTRGEFESLRGDVRNTVLAFAAKLRSGEACAAPVSDGDTDPCEYCKNKAICRAASKSRARRK